MNEAKHNNISMDQETEVQYRIFVSAVNSITGQCIVETLRNDSENDINPHIIVGTLDEEDPTPCCRGLKRLINNKDPKELLNVMLDCDVIIYDATKANYDEICFVIKTLRSFNYTEEKTFILISSVLSWSETPQKELLDEETGEAIEIMSVKTGRTGKTGRTIAGMTDISVNPMDRKSNYSENEYTFRRALPCYEYLRSLENITMMANKDKPTLRTYVLCSGIIYGHGEDSLYELFEVAFEGREALNKIGEGRNSIPMIHCQDLANMVKFLVLTKPEGYDYIHAIDHSKIRSQQSIIKAISKGMGDTKIDKLSYLDCIYVYNYNILTLNVNLLPSALFNVDEDGEMIIEDHKEINGEDNDGNNKVTKSVGKKKDTITDSSEDKEFKFRWKYKDGFTENFDQIFEEFKIFRQIKTFRLVTTGMPFLGKSHYSKIIAKHFKLPYIQVDELIEHVKKRTDEIGEEVNSYLDNEKERMVSEARAELEKLRAKKKKNLPEDINEDEYIPVLSEEMINKVIQWRVLQSDCINKGYILDSYPVSYQQARDIFLEEVVTKIVHEIPPKEEDEREEEEETEHVNESQESFHKSQMDESVAGGEEEQKPEVETIVNYVPREKIMPQKVFNFLIDDETEIQNYIKLFFDGKKALEDLEASIANKGEDKEAQNEDGLEVNERSQLDIEETMYSIDNVAKRVEEFKKYNQSQKGSKTYLDFYKEQQIEICRVNPQEVLRGTKDSSIGNKNVMEYVCEKLDADFTWNEGEEEQEENNLEAEFISGDKILVGDKKELVESEMGLNEESNVLKDGLSKEERDKQIEDIMLEEQKILNRKSQALKQYITDNILPVLTSGLIEICNEKPSDPLDYLADYLLKKSLEIRK